MSLTKKAWFGLMVMVLFGFVRTNKNHHIEINLNYQNADLLFRWFGDFSNRQLIDSICGEAGSQIMEDNVRQLSDPPGITIKSFREELTSFTPADTTNSFIYGTGLAFKLRKQSFLLLKQIKEQQVKDTIVQRALVYIPNDYSISTTGTIYLVLTGWQWGDAYVCNVKHKGSRYYIANEGEPSIVVNLSLISKLYGETAAEQIKALNGILSHEIFHFLFANYKRKSPVYAHPDTSMIGKLFEVIQNEGIAHYIDKKPLLLNEYGKDPKYANLDKQNIDKLNGAFDQLMDKNLDEFQKQQLLTKASTGKYWTKYGSISGMFMAFHLEKEKGKRILLESIRKGPEYFVKQYLDLCRSRKDLPRPSTTMEAYLLHNIR